ncbi:MAG: type II secretion system F family protein [Candidatus Doudnabacteria bacterium]|nr:type II secretion system F family protein [Candidatus Doudnabacteria bacterium]
MEYTYEALTKDGRRERATIKAASLSVAGHMLKEQGLIPVEIKEKDEKNVFDLLRKFSTISLDEKLGFVENLQIMYKAGISLPKALQILTKQTKNLRFKSILSDVCGQVQSGKYLSDALAMHSGVFSNIFLSMVKVGEMSGSLEKSLEYLTIQLKREADLKSKTKGAMIYPSVIVGAMLIIGVAMSIFVLPKLTSVFKDFSTELPFATRVIVKFADFMSGHAVVVIGGLIAVIAGVVSFLRTSLGEKLFDFGLLHTLVIGDIVRKINLARFSRILSSLLKSSINMVQALEVTSESLGNVAYKEITAEAAEQVKVGKNLTDTLSQSPNLFPVLVVQMLQVGEESGTVEDMLNQLAEHYEDDVDNTLRNLSSIIEPLLLLVIGGVVGVLAMALIMPIYNISQNIK